jgi:hypothetical protein
VALRILKSGDRTCGPFFVGPRQTIAYANAPSSGRQVAQGVMFWIPLALLANRDWDEAPQTPAQKYRATESRRQFQELFEPRMLALGKHLRVHPPIGSTKHGPNGQHEHVSERVNRVLRARVRHVLKETQNTLGHRSAAVTGRLAIHPQTPVIEVSVDEKREAPAINGCDQALNPSGRNPKSACDVFRPVIK